VRAEVCPTVSHHPITNRPVAPPIKLSVISPSRLQTLLFVDTTLLDGHATTVENYPTITSFSDSIRREDHLSDRSISAGVIRRKEELSILREYNSYEQGF
jgi:hypothetical protein